MNLKTGDQVKIHIGNRTKLVEATVIEQIGNGVLAKTEKGKFCSVHYDFRGRLRARKLSSEKEARELAEETKDQMS